MSRIAWNAAVSQKQFNSHKIRRKKHIAPKIFTVDIQHGHAIVTGIGRVFCFSSYSVVPLYRQICATGKGKQEKTGNETVARFISIPQDLRQQCTWLAFSSDPFAHSWLGSTTFLSCQHQKFFSVPGNLRQACIKLGKTQTGGLRGELLFRGRAPAYSA